MITILFLICVTLCKISHGVVEVNTGAYFQALPEVISYETSIPLIYDIQFMSNSVKRMIDSCCKQNSSLSIICQPIINGIIINNSTRNILATDGTSAGWNFQIASRNHVQRMFTTPEESVVFRERIKTYPIKFEVQNRTMNPTLTINSCNVNSINAYSSMLHYQVTQLISACHARHLSPEVVNMEKFQQDLTVVQIRIENNDYRLAIANAGHYYGLPLTDCLITSTNAILGVHIPILKKRVASVQLRRLIPAPMAWLDNTCVLSAEHADLAIVSNLGTDAVDIMTPECDPHRDRLCAIPRNHESVLTATCAKLLLTGASINEFVKHCPITCHPAKPGTRLVTVVNTNVFLLTHINKIYIPERNITVITNSEYGAIWIQLPCNHTAVLSGKITLYPTYPCVLFDIKFEYKQIIPAAWVKTETLNLPPFDLQQYPVFNGLEECLNEEAVKINDSDLSTRILLYAPWPVIIIFVIIYICRHVSTIRRTRETYADLIAQRILRREPNYPPPYPENTNPHLQTHTNIDTRTIRTQPRPLPRTPSYHESMNSSESS